MKHINLGHDGLLWSASGHVSGKGEAGGHESGVESWKMKRCTHEHLQSEKLEIGKEETVEWLAGNSFKYGHRKRERDLLGGQERRCECTYQRNRYKPQL